MMNAYNNNNKQYGKAIESYEIYNNKSDDITQILFIKACITGNEYEKVNKIVMEINEEYYKSIDLYVCKMQ